MRPYSNWHKLKRNLDPQFCMSISLGYLAENKTILDYPHMRDWAFAQTMGGEMDR
jgi:hypothetical protein